MNTRFVRGSSVLLNAAGEGGGGGSAPSPSAVAAVPPVAPPSGDNPAATPPVAGDPASQQAAVDYWPEGLDPALKGADAKATLDNMAKSLKGYRELIASRNVPETPEGYTDFAKLGDKFQIDPKNAPHFEALKTDPVFKSITAAAHKHGVGQLAVAEIYQSALNSMSEAGILTPPIDHAAEEAAFVPDAAKNLPPNEQKAAVDKRVNENYAFLDLMVANRGMPKDLAEHVELSLCSQAKGHMALEWFKAQLQAGGAQPGAHGQAGGAVTAESLAAEMAVLEAGKHLPDYKQKHTALQEKYRTFHGG